MSDSVTLDTTTTATVITEADLLAAGYYRISSHPDQHALGNWFRAAFQKRFRDSRGTKYFLEFVLGEYPPSLGQTVLQFSSPSAQFCRKRTNFSISMHRHRETVEEVHDFFDKLWSSMECSYYEFEMTMAEPIEITDIKNLIAPNT